MPKIAKYIGPPGTGKTYTLLRQIAIDAEKHQPEMVGAVSLTKGAVSEIKARISSELGIAKERIPNVQTLHSHCFRLLHMTRDQVAETPKNITEFNKLYPQHQITTETPKDDEGIACFERADKTRQASNDELHAESNKFRQTLKPIGQWPWDTAQWYNAWAHYCQEHGLTDYTGMQEKVLKFGHYPEIEVLHIDEGQDISPLGHQLIQQFGEQCEKVVWYGDADQSIFRFAGADPETFINIKADWRHVLEQSYRCSPSIVNYSQEIIKKCRNREEAPYHPCMDHGEGSKRWERTPNLDLPGTHMILCRTKAMLDRWVTRLANDGIPYFNPYRKADLKWNPLDSTAFRAVRSYNRYLAGYSIDTDEYKAILKHSKANECFQKRGDKKQSTKIKRLSVSLMDAHEIGFSDKFLSGQSDISQIFTLPDNRTAILLRNMNLRKSVMENPRVIVGTIHSVKGGEADHVWIDPGLPSAVMKAIAERTALDDEIRLAYVGITRAKQSIGIISPLSTNDSGVIYG